MKLSAKGKKIAFSSVIVIAIPTVALFFSWELSFKNKTLPGTTIGGLNIGGLNYQKSENSLKERLALFENQGITLSYGKKTVTLPIKSISFDSDLAKLFINFNYQESLSEIFNKNGEQSFANFFQYLVGLKSKEIKISYELDETAIDNFIKDSFKDEYLPAQNAYFSLESRNGRKEITLNQESIGKEINLPSALSDIKERIENLDQTPIELRTRSQYPQIKEADLAGLKEEAKNLANDSGLTVSLKENGETLESWKISQKTIINWISSQKISGQTSLSLDKEKIYSYLEKYIAPDIDKEAVLPRFEISNNKVISWQGGENGRKLNLEKSAASLEEALINKLGEAEIYTETIESRSLENEDLQIKEIIGTGHSNFKGSSENRKKNIRVGANTLHGLLIKPDEEFSVISSLGEIDAKAGYVPELVIKGDKTIPEYGGGLCQIGTTVFRTALASGLPITMRQNHSYRVSYYEPAGTDATIYDPQPDLRFLNDTGNYILIQARISGNDLYFDFWGVKDGRSASTTYPTIYNIVKPEPTKIIETDDLEPGKKKCTESSHNGADAFFDYHVVYPDGRITDKRFQSHYVPWQGVCLVGREKTATSTEEVLNNNEGVASSTPTITSTSTSPTPSE